MKRPLLALCVLICGAATIAEARAEPIIIIDPSDLGRQSICASTSGREWRTCLFREVNEASQNWKIQVYEGVGIRGTPGAEIVVRDAVSVLQGIVDSCDLGKAFLVRATDGVAFLHVGNPNLTEEQIECIRSFEQRGLWLEGENR